jgi:hypothetical protein
LTHRAQQLLAWEQQLKQAVRDAVNRPSRKPFTWGGLAGYQQLAAIADGLRQIVDGTPSTAFLRQLLSQVERALEGNRALANDVAAAHLWLRQVATVLHYRLPCAQEGTNAPTSQTVAQAMCELLIAFQPNGKRQPAQTALASALRRTWRAYGAELLHCYDIPGLPPDNLALEALFSRLRRHQRRISGRKSTHELRSFGHYQVLLQADSEQQLLQQIQTVSPARYRFHRHCLDQAEAPRRFLHRLHRNPNHTIQQLVHAYKAGPHQPTKKQSP